ncbi:hypothetical protein, partial [Escherichia coli]|uniref:hypothetical protein n=1 Tax=Escherichia coli TaxID=562 RepID=UPI001BC8A029
MGSCAAPSAKGDDKFITTDYLQQCLQEYDVNLYQQVHFALWEQVIATQLRTEGLHEDRTPVWRLRG